LCKLLLAYSCSIIIRCFTSPLLFTTVCLITLASNNEEILSTRFLAITLFVSSFQSLFFIVLPFINLFLCGDNPSKVHILSDKLFVHLFISFRCKFFHNQSLWRQSSGLSCLNQSVISSAPSNPVL